jgi:hypothetical protein
MELAVQYAVELDSIASILRVILISKKISIVVSLNLKNIKL